MEKSMREQLETDLEKIKAGQWDEQIEGPFLKQEVVDELIKIIYGE